MTTALGECSSVNPLPVGRPNRHAVGVAGQIPFPAANNWLYSSDDGSIGPINLPYRYWLCCIANNLILSATPWTRYDVAIRLVVNGSYGPDLLGQSVHQNADSNTNGIWASQSIEAKFFCEANTAYHVYVVAYGGGAGGSYYQMPQHMHMYAYTVGEGVY